MSNKKNKDKHHKHHKKHTSDNDIDNFKKSDYQVFKSSVAKLVENPTIDSSENLIQVNY